MLVSEQKLRSIIHRLLLEGRKDLLADIFEANPDATDQLKSEISNLQNPSIMWLHRRFSSNPTIEEIHPLNDTVVTLKNYSNKAASLNSKYKENAQFKELIDQEKILSDRTRTLADYVYLTVDNMEDIMKLAFRKKQSFKTDYEKDAISSEKDRIGKVGPWNIWLPSTKPNSCFIAGYDKDTAEPHTTWCTARTSGSNLFYSYIGSSGQSLMLFYIIKDDRKEATDWMSIGYIDKEINLSGEGGSTSVDRDNEGLTPEKLKSALGQHYDQILSIMNKKVSKLGGVSPAMVKIKHFSQNAEDLEAELKTLSKTERQDFELSILDNSPSSDVLVLLSSSTSYKARMKVANNPVTPSEILVKLSTDEDEYVRRFVANNLSIPPEIFVKLSTDKDKDVRYSVASNPNTPPEILVKLSADKNNHVRRAVARNLSTPAAILAKLATDEDEDMRFAAKKAIAQINQQNLNESVANRWQLIAGI